MEYLTFSLGITHHPYQWQGRMGIHTESVCHKRNKGRQPKAFQLFI